MAISLTIVALLLLVWEQYVHSLHAPKLDRLSFPTKRKMTNVKSTNIYFDY